MRGDDLQQAGMFSYLSPEQRVPQDHPLRAAARRHRGSILCGCVGAVARAPVSPKQKHGPVPMSHPWRRFDFTENSMLARERRGELCILRK
ncbi:MAG TPA: hypothetical protein VI306_26245 [Pyrinomonadaceae bacterium]